MDPAITDESRPEFQLQIGDGVDITRLKQLYDETVNDLNERIEQDADNYETRHCIWPGQSPDQRKHVAGRGDTQPFPWDGASDLKVPVVDEIINHGVALDCTALSRANIRAVAIEGGDIGKASLVSNFMRWLVLSQMTELPREAEILANYRRERGLGVLGIFWDSRVQKTQQRLALTDAAQDVAEAIAQGVFTDELVNLLKQTFGVSAKKAEAMIGQLRETGETTVPMVVSQVSRPCVKAYAIGEDLFLPPNTQDLQSARAIFRRVFLSPEQLREKVISEGWDKDYVDYVIQTCISAQHASSSSIGSPEQIRLQQSRLSLNETEENTGLVEIVYAYERLSDEDGVPGIYCTVFCPSAGQYEDAGVTGYAKHELLGYRHGLYPFVVFARERLSRLLLDSRGVPEVGRGWQDAIKTEVDARRDNASLSTCPPVRHPAGRDPGRIGPGLRISERRPGEYGYMDIPPAPGASVEIQQRIENMTRRYFGRPVADDTVQEWQVKQQHEVRVWLESWSLVFRQVWDLYQQYGPEEEFFRVIGSQTAGPEQFRKDQVSGKYDFYLTFDVLSMDPESWMAKLEAMGKFAQQFDKYGVVDYSKLLQIGFSYIDPVLAEQIILPSQVAADREVKDTQDDIAKMWGGVDLDVPPGVNAQLRLQTLQGWVQGPQDNPAIDVQSRLQSDDALRNRVDRYRKQLEFVLQQQQNAVTGRIGAPSAGSQGSTGGGM